MKLTIGMAHYDDYNGAYFSIQDIRKELVYSGREDLLNRIEFLVVENNPDGKHAESLQKLFKNQVVRTGDCSIHVVREVQGTSATRNKIIEAASGDFVLVMDCHVLLCPTVKVIEAVFQFMEMYPNADDLYSGPLVYDDMQGFSTHFNSVWSSGMLGQWGAAWGCQCGATFSVINHHGKSQYVDLVSQKPVEKCIKCGVAFPPMTFHGHKKVLRQMGYRELGTQDLNFFEIPAQGLGTFLTKKETWLGFNPHCRGFGGEEWYIHEKYRKAGRKAICLPFLTWLHRFKRPDGVPYKLTNNDKLRNYILEFTELGLDPEPVIRHFTGDQGMDMDLAKEYLNEAKRIYET